jgi:hypothetical protein
MQISVTRISNLPSKFRFLFFLYFREKRLDWLPTWLNTSAWGIIGAGGIIWAGVASKKALLMLANTPNSTIVSIV